MRTIRTKAIILRRTNYGEADRVLQLLTPEGRFGVMARGVRKEKSRLAGAIELFSIVDVVVAEGRGELWVLTSAKLTKFFSNIITDYDRLQFGYFVIKHIARASGSIDEPVWFDVLSDLLFALDLQTIDLRLIESWFYIRYAAAMGHAFNSEFDTDGSRLVASGSYRYDDGEMGLESAVDGEVGSEHIKLIRLLATRPLGVLSQIGGLDDILPICLNIAKRHAAI